MMFEIFKQMVFCEVFHHLWEAFWDSPLQAHDHGGLCCMLLCRVTLGRARKLDSEFHVNKTQLEEVVCWLPLDMQN